LRAGSETGDTAFSEFAFLNLSNGAVHCCVHGIFVPRLQRRAGRDIGRKSVFRASEHRKETARGDIMKYVMCTCRIGRQLAS
jgi:hypothetical protein